MLPSIRRRSRRGSYPVTMWDWDGDSIFDRLFNEFESVFGDSYTVDRERGEVTYEFEVPGFNKDNLKVEVADGLLTINGERNGKEGQLKKVAKQMNVGNVENVDAVLQDGILTLTLRYPTAKTTPVQISDGQGQLEGE